MRRRTRPGAACALALLGSAALAQYALDNNLRVGSGRVNEAARPGLQRELYRPAVTPTSGALYVRSDTGTMVYSANNAFNPSKTYTALKTPTYAPATPVYTQTGYSQDIGARGWHAQFRGY